MGQPSTRTIKDSIFSHNFDVQKKNSGQSQLHDLPRQKSAHLLPRFKCLQLWGPGAGKRNAWDTAGKNCHKMFRNTLCHNLFDAHGMSMDKASYQISASSDIFSFCSPMVYIAKYGMWAAQNLARNAALPDNKSDKI